MSNVEYRMSKENRGKHLISTFDIHDSIFRGSPFFKTMAETMIKAPLAVHEPQPLQTKLSDLKPLEFRQVRGKPDGKD